MRLDRCLVSLRPATLHRVEAERLGLVLVWTANVSETIETPVVVQFGDVRDSL
jgi:hypothetical protein